MPVSDTSCYRMGGIEYGLILFMSLYYFLPSVSQAIPFTPVLGLAVVYTLYVWINSPQYAAKEIIKCLVLVLLLSFLYYHFTATKTIAITASNYNLKRFISKFYQLFMSFFPVLLLYRVVNIASKRQIRFILMLCTVIFFFVVANTIGTVSRVRDATRAFENFTAMEEDNIATYTFVYAGAFLFPLAVQLYRSSMRGSMLKVLSLVASVVIFTFMIMAQYTLALFIAVIGACAVLLSDKEKSYKILLLILAVPIVLFIFPFLLRGFASLITFEGMQKRIIEVADFLDVINSSTALQAEGGYNLNGRLMLYQMTIEAFLRSPLTGNSYLPFDGHATFLTVLADLGVLGAIPMYYLFFSMKKRVNYILFEGNSDGLYDPYFLCLILMGFVNPILSAFPMSFSVFFLSPLFLAYYYT